jgi:glycosyltransferase involved in cell wall biosynthesis
MIVKDEEKNLPIALESFRGLFDELIVVDTGSRDRTVEIARSFGARVFDFPWVDDFAAARDAALARATGDYAFWFDADDLLDPPQRPKLEALLDRLRDTQRGDPPMADTVIHRPSQAPFAPPTAFVVRCACDPYPDGSGQTVVDHIRLFPLCENIRWTYRVHEQILPALNRARVPVEWSDVVIRHTGYTDPVLREKKLDRDVTILLEDLEDSPNDPFLLFNLGHVAIERRQWNDALGYLRHSLDGSAPTDSITRKLFALIARAHQMLGDSEAALRTCAEGLAIDAQDAELWFRKGLIHRHRREPHQAEACWRKILRLRRPDRFCSIDEGIYGHITRRNLAVLAFERGDPAGALKLWREVLAECPGDREALAILSR